MEAYTSALAEERGVPSISRSKDDQTLTNRLNEMLADLRRSVTQLEGAGREEWVSQLTEQGRFGDLERLAERERWAVRGDLSGLHEACSVQRIFGHVIAIGGIRGRQLVNSS